MTDEEIERTRRRVIKFEDEGSQATPPKPAPRSSFQQAPPVESRPAGDHSYHTLQAGTLPRQFSNRDSTLSQSMIVIPQKFQQLNFASPNDAELGAAPYASATMKPDFHAKKIPKYENHDVNASMPNLSSVPVTGLPRKMARPNRTSVTSTMDSDNYIIPNPVFEKIGSGGSHGQEPGRPRVIRCDDLMSIDSTSLASLTGSNHSEGGTSLMVNFPGGFSSSTSVPSFKAKVGLSTHLF